MNPPSPFSAGLRLRCPRCGEGRVLSGLLTVREVCEPCGLNLKSHDTGDGPAFFVITFWGMFVTFLAGWIEFHYEPPFWLQAAIWAPIIIGGSIFLLRVFKSLLIAYQYKHHLLHSDDR